MADADSLPPELLELSELEEDEEDEEDSEVLLSLSDLDVSLSLLLEPFSTGGLGRP